MWPLAWNRKRLARGAGWPRRMLWAVGGPYLLALLLLMLFEEAIIFPVPPAASGNWRPADLTFEDVYFESADGTRLHGWYVDHPRPRAHLLYCHGNGDDVSRLTPLLRDLNEAFDVAVFAFDYRGYGQSQGEPREAGVLADGHAAQAWLARRAGVAPSEVVLMGRSLGGAVAVDLASRQGARGLVLESTFTSMPDVAARLFWWAPVRWLMRTKFDSHSKIADYRGPLLQSHGTADSLVALASGRALFAQAPTRNKRFLEIAGGDHNDPQTPEYYRELDRFLNELPPLTQQTARAKTP